MACVIHIVEVGLPPFGAGTIQTRRAYADVEGFVTLVAPPGAAGNMEMILRWRRA